MTFYAVIASVAFVGLWIGLAGRVLARHRQLSRFDLLLALFLLGATVDTLSAVGISLLPTPWPHVLMMVSSLPGLIVAVEMARILAASTGPAPRTAGVDELLRPSDRLRHRWWGRAAAVVGVLVTSAAAMWGMPQGTIPAAVWGSVDAHTVYWLIYGLFHLVTCGLMLVLAVRIVAAWQPGALRQAGWLLVAALVVGIGYGTALVVLAVEGRFGQWNGLGAAGYAWGSVQYLLLALAYGRVRLSRQGRRGADEATLRQLRPLWVRLRFLDPDYVLDENMFTARGAAARLACVRAAAEIRDWMALAARRLPAASWRRAQAAAARELPDADLLQVTAAALAGWVQAAVTAPPARRPALGPGHSPAPTVGDDIDEELALLAAAAAVAPLVAERVAAAVTADRSLLPQ